jgi:hypothetical protein
MSTRTQAVLARFVNRIGTLDNCAHETHSWRGCCSPCQRHSAHAIETDQCGSAGRTTTARLPAYDRERRASPAAAVLRCGRPSHDIGHGARCRNSVPDHFWRKELSACAIVGSRVLPRHRADAMLTKRFGASSPPGGRIELREVTVEDDFWTERNQSRSADR